jgi:hypothetical protein
VQLLVARLPRQIEQEIAEGKTTARPDYPPPADPAAVSPLARKRRVGRSGPNRASPRLQPTAEIVKQAGRSWIRAPTARCADPGPTRLARERGGSILSRHSARRYEIEIPATHGPCTECPFGKSGKLFQPFVTMKLAGLSFALSIWRSIKSGIIDAG